MSSLYNRTVKNQELILYTTERLNIAQFFFILTKLDFDYSLTYLILEATIRTLRKAGEYDTVTMDIKGQATREIFNSYNMVDDVMEITEAVKKMEAFLFGRMDEKRF